MPTEPLEPADEHAIAAAGRGVGGVHAEPGGHRVEGPGELGAREVREAVLPRPLVAHAVGRSEARRIVDHGAAAQRGALQEHEAEIARGEEAAAVVQLREPFGFVVREVRFVPVRALLEHDDVSRRPASPLVPQPRK